MDEIEKKMQNYKLTPNIIMLIWSFGKSNCVHYQY